MDESGSSSIMTVAVSANKGEAWDEEFAVLDGGVKPSLTEENNIGLDV